MITKIFSALTVLLLFTVSANAQFMRTSTAPVAAGFEKNVGQVRSANPAAAASVLYRAQRNGCAMFVTASGFNLVVKEAAGESERVQNIAFQFVGGQAPTEIIESNKATYPIRYYNGNSEHITTHCTMLTAKNVYPGVDVRYYTLQNSFKYEFVAESQAALKNIAVKIAGSDGVSLKGNTTVIAAGSRTITELEPTTWYENSNGSKTSVECTRTLNNGTIGYSIASNQPATAKRIVVDPEIIWSSYIGGSNADEPASIVSGSDNYYATGTTQSADFPATQGVSQMTLNGTYDGYLAEISEGGTVFWVTYFGGSGPDLATCVAHDNRNRAVVIAGSTLSSDLPLAVNSAAGSGNGFVAKFDRGTGALRWSAYVGDDETETLAGVVVTPINSNILCVGSTATSQTAIDAFAARLDSSGAKIFYRKYSSPTIDQFTGVVSDNATNFIISGYTGDKTVIGDMTGKTNNPYTGNVDGFVCKLDVDGNPFWITFMGGNGNDYCTSIATEGGTGFAVGGHTNSDNFYVGKNPAPIPLVEQRQFGNDIFVARLSITGEQQFARLLGGSEEDNYATVASLSGGRIAVCGQTNSSDILFILNAIPNAVQKNMQGNNDVFVAEVNSNAVVVWATYLGGTGADYPGGIAAAEASKAVIVGVATDRPSLGGGLGYKAGVDAAYVMLPQIPLSVDENQSSAMLSPMPFTTWIDIPFATNNVALYTLSGEKLSGITVSAMQNSTRVALPELTNGTYLIQWSSAAGMQRALIIK